MSAQRKPRSARRQRGQAMILTAVLIVIGVVGLVLGVTRLASNAIASRQAKNTEIALAQVRDALIGWSASRDPASGTANARPGELPCPDTDNTGTDSGTCVAGAIGRVPWKSLGIPEPRDGTGETLWYSVAGPFRHYSVNTSPITSNTLGNLTVYGGDSSTTVTSQAVAIIFSAGSPVGAQIRDATAAACSTTGTTIARNLCAANYLEAAGGGNNAQTGGPFIQASPSSTFNDRMLVITNADLMPLVEQRVAREMISLLQRYRAATATSLLGTGLLPLGGAYPWADLADGESNGAPLAVPPNAYNRNRFPCGGALPVDWNTTGSALLVFLMSAPTPALPNWLTNGCASLTGWNGVIYYAVARNRLESSGIGCTTCSAATLTVNNPSSRVATVCTGNSPTTCTPSVTSGSASLVLITPGAASTDPRGTWPTSSWSAITGYFDDAENSDNNNTDDTYVVPTSNAYNRNRLFLVP